MGAADIIKLKANGYYTVAVSIATNLAGKTSFQLILVQLVRPRRNTQDPTQSQRLQRGEGREDQGGYCQMPSKSKPQPYRSPMSSLQRPAFEDNLLIKPLWTAISIRVHDSCRAWSSEEAGLQNLDW